MLRIGCLCAFFALTGLALSACSFAEDPPPRQAPAPSVPGDSGAMDTFRALAPAEGLKFSVLFPDRNGDPELRLGRVEDVVQALRNDFDTVLPTLIRLAAIEKDMKSLVTELQTLTDTQPTADPASAVTVMPALPPPAYTGDPRAAPLVSGNQITAPAIAPAPSSNSPVAIPATGQQIPGEGAAGGTETAGREKKAEPNVSPSLVTPEAALKGQLPPEGAASPISKPAPAATTPAPAATRPAPARSAPTPAPAAPTPLTQDERPINWSLGYDGARAVLPLAPAAPVAPPAAAAPVVPPAPKAAAPAAAAPPSVKPAPKPAAKAVRAADHKDKTRLVIDLSAPASCKTTVGGKKNKTLFVECAGIDWSAIKSFDAETGALVAGWRVAEGKLVVDLLSVASVKSSSVLPPGAAPSHRLVIDLTVKNPAGGV